jgi:hypothetical protein
MHRRASILALFAAPLLTSHLGADTLEFATPQPIADGSFGASVALCHDIDFDGYADVIVGAPGETSSGLAGAGRIRVYSGKSGALLRTQVSTQVEAGGAFGAAVLGLPDLNGDGRSEYAVGAPNENGGVGRVRVYSGQSGALLWTGTGLAGTKGHGGCLALVPDATGDGKAELAVGNGGSAADQTSVRLYHAVTGISWKFLNRPATYAGAIGFGHAISGVPDVTGDGKGDIIVGAPFADSGSTTDRGAAWIFDGATGSLVRELITIDPETNGRFGFSVAGIGDLDGDGRGDVLVGAPREDVDASNGGVGRVHAYSGASGSSLYSVTLPTQWSGAGFGSAIAVANNFDDDGVPDFVVTAPYAGSGGEGWGYRYSGVDGSTIGYAYYPNAGSTGFGLSVSAAGDATQDGRSDIAFGAPLTPNGGTMSVGKAELKRIVLNDACGPDLDTPAVDVGGFYFSNVGATNFQDLEATCDGTAVELLNSDVHFTFAAPVGGTLTVSTCATSFDSWIALYRGCNFTQFGCVWGLPDACNDDGDCGNGGSTASLPVAAGECVRIRVGGVGVSQGVATLQVDFEEAGCVGDFDGNGLVDGADLGALLGSWGSNAALDLTGDGAVDGADLAIVLGGWGGC